jgi:uncharacterized protein
MAPVEAGFLRVEVVYCPQPGVTDLVALSFAPGATVADALRLSGHLERHALPLDGLRVGVWCRARELTSVLRDRDRVEIYRPLTVDPKEARRLRYKRTRGAVTPAA